MVMSCYYMDMPIIVTYFIKADVCSYIWQSLRCSGFVLSVVVSPWKIHAVSRFCLTKPPAGTVKEEVHLTSVVIYSQCMCLRQRGLCTGDFNYACSCSNFRIPSFNPRYYSKHGSLQPPLVSTSCCFLHHSFLGNAITYTAHGVISLCEAAINRPLSVVALGILLLGRVRESVGPSCLAARGHRLHL